MIARGAKMTIIITRNVESRYRGFIASIMLEVAPGVYVAPTLTAGVRDRLWQVLSDWWRTLRNGSIIMLCRDVKAAGKLRIESLGVPPKEIVDADGVLLVKRG